MRKAHLSLVMFRLEKHAFALEASAVKGMRDDPDGTIAASPCAHHAADLLAPGGREASRSSPNHWLQLGHEQGDWRLGVPGEATLVRLPLHDLHPLPDLLAQCCRLPALKALGFHQGELVALLDPARLRPSR